MAEIYKDYIDILRKISIDDYTQYKDSTTVSIFMNILATYIGKENIDLLNPIRVQQFTDYIKLKHSDIFELKDFNIYILTKDLEDNIPKKSFIISIDYIEKIMDIWNEYVDNVKSKKITTWCYPIYNIRNPYISNYIPCSGTRIKIPIKHINKNSTIMYATYNSKYKWCIHNIEVDGETLKGINLSLNKNEEYISLELSKDKEFEMECKIIRGVESIDSSNGNFILKTHNGHFPTQELNYDVPFCLFFNDGNDGLMKIKDLKTLKKCLNIEEERNSILITPQNLEYYSYFLNFTINPAFINYNNLQVFHNYPCNMYNNNLRIIYGRGYSCSFDNIKNSKIKREVDLGASFIGGYKEIESFLGYINYKEKIPYSLNHYEVMEIKNINNDYEINPCNGNQYSEKHFNNIFGEDESKYGYYGAAKNIYNGDDVSFLSSFELKDKKDKITVNAGKDEYIYYCVPSKMGEQFFIVNGFEGGFNLNSYISVLGNEYAIYKSNHTNLGITTIQII
ncbi:MAG: hypothetical protein ACRC1T_04955 [Clostridium chrysemydis]|uniref:hypothetical protein n=1 Tax=Clostridium chrysemydis TaxID=2665504 RepID=UPI003F2E353C